MRAVVHVAPPAPSCAGLPPPATPPCSLASPAGLVEVRQPQWVSEARWTPDGWLLSGRGRDQGLFDAVVIAHNGKCANRCATQGHQAPAQLNSHAPSPLPRIPCFNLFHPLQGQALARDSPVIVPVRPTALCCCRLASPMGVPQVHSQLRRLKVRSGAGQQHRAAQQQLPWTAQPSSLLVSFGWQRWRTHSCLPPTLPPAVGQLGAAGGLCSACGCAGRP